MSKRSKKLAAKRKKMLSRWYKNGMFDPLDGEYQSRKGIHIRRYPGGPVTSQTRKPGSRRDNIGHN
jgi:hypothetical protein